MSIRDNCTTLHELSTNLYELGKHHGSDPLKLPTHNCESACERTAYLESQGKPLQCHSIESFQRSWPTLHSRLVLKGATIFFLTSFQKNRRTFVATSIRQTYVTPKSLRSKVKQQVEAHSQLDRLIHNGNACV